MDPTDKATRAPIKEQWEKRYRRAGVAASWVYIGGPPLIGLVVGLLDDFGRNADPTLFVVVAEGLLPVLLVTVVVQSSLVNQRQFELDPSELTEQKIRRNLTSALALFVVGESVALYAVAANTSSTFLVVTPLVACLMFLTDVLFATRHQFGTGIEKYLPSRMIESMAKREEDARLKTAQQLEERAQALRQGVESKHGDGQGEGLS